jgi:RNA polymerase sigma-70 factor (ECF subfamily)
MKVLTESDAQTLDALLTPLLGLAYGYAYRLLRNSAEAEDLLQEAALAAVRGFGTFQPGTNFKAWFFQVLTNCFYSRHRRTKREGASTELDDVPELYLYERTAEIGLHEGSDPARQLMSRLDGDAIAEALGSLPEEYRVVSTLYFMEDFTYDEIASVLSVPVGTVRSRLHRSRKLLQRRLWPIAVEHGILEAKRTDP